MLLHQIKKNICKLLKSRGLLSPRSKKSCCSVIRMPKQSTYNSHYNVNGHAVALTVVKSAKRKNSMTIKVETDGIKILTPLSTPDQSIHSFLDTKQNRIEKKREMMKTRHKSIKEFKQGSQIPYLGESFPLKVVMNDEVQSDISFDEQEFTCVLPNGISIQEQKKRIAVLLKHWYIKQAKVYVLRETVRLADQNGLKIGNIHIKNYKAKYGQCAGNDLFFSYKIIQFPENIVQHIILHELAHIKHKDHSKRFRSFLSKIDEKTKDHVKRLKENGVMLE